MARSKNAGARNRLELRSDPETIEARRYAAVARSESEQLLRRVIAKLIDLEDDLRELADLSQTDTFRAWKAAGVPSLGPHDHAGDDLLDKARHVSEEANGFLWATGHALALFEGVVIRGHADLVTCSDRRNP